MSSKKPRLQLYADECIPVPTVTHLKGKGISIIHAYDKNHLQKIDQFHLRYSKNIGRVLLSLDRDFQKFKDTSLTDHPGIILISVGNVAYKHINDVLDKILKHLSEDSVKGFLIRATINKIVREKEGSIEYMMLNAKKPKWTR